MRALVQNSCKNRPLTNIFISTSIFQCNIQKEFFKKNTGFFFSTYNALLSQDSVKAFSVKGSTTGSDSRPYRLIAHGIRLNITSERLKKHFKDFQLATSVQDAIAIPRGTIDMNCDYQNLLYFILTCAADVKGRLCGFAYVYFDDPTEARRAARSLDQRYLDSFRLTLKVDVPDNFYYKKKYYIERMKRYDYNDVDNVSKT